MAEAAGDRAVTAVVGKVLEVGLVVLFVSAVTLTLYGGAVPAYRTATGDAVAERTLAAATQRLQQAVPPNASRVRASATVSLPDTIRGRAYEVVAVNRSLVLEHPHPAVEATARLALPTSVANVSGSWTSTRPARVAVRGGPAGLAVELREGSA